MASFFADVPLLSVAASLVVGVTPVLCYFLWTRRGQEAGDGGGGNGRPRLRHRQGKPDPARKGHAPLIFDELSDGQVRARAREYAEVMESRRSVRFFSPRQVPLEVITDVVRAAAASPSGAHQQPWTFVVVRSAEVKQKIRELVEAEEKVNYERRMGAAWVDDVKELVKDLHDDDGGVRKPYLTEAPYLIVVMKQPAGLGPNGENIKHHYAVEGVGIASGALVCAIQNAGLATLTSTPLGAGARICEVLNRPRNEKVFLLLPVGFPAKDCTVPYRAPGQVRKPLEQVMPVV